MSIKRKLDSADTQHRSFVALLQREMVELRNSRDRALDTSNEAEKRCKEAVQENDRSVEQVGEAGWIYLLRSI